MRITSSEFPEDEVEEPIHEDEEAEDSSTLAESLQSLPLIGGDAYLRTQAFNIGLVSQILDDMEHQILLEYMAGDRTPPSAMVVSAISQLWVFGLYELLRTWRQLSLEILKFGTAAVKLSDDAREQRIAEQKEKFRQSTADPEISRPAHAHAFELSARDEEFRDVLRNGLDRSELPFRRLEALRIHLAKHEIPKTKGLYGMAPGYGRIDESTGSIFWQVPLGNMEVDVISRQALANACQKFPKDESIPFLPELIRHKLIGISKQSYGVKLVILILDDGSEYEAFVAWDRQILKVRDFDPLPFDPNEVVDIRAL
jgi:hypothetical protein